MPVGEADGVPAEEEQAKAADAASRTAIPMANGARRMEYSLDGSTARGWRCG